MSCSTIGPSGLGGRLGPRLGAVPGGWPLSRPPAGFLLQCGRPALRAAGPAGCWTRAGSPAAGRTATEGAVPALAPAAGSAVRTLPPVRGWPSLESRTPAWLSWLRAPESRSRRRCSSSASWRRPWLRLRSSGPPLRPRCWSRRLWLVPAKGTHADQRIPGCL